MQLERRHTSGGVIQDEPSGQSAFLKRVVARPSLRFAASGLRAMAFGGMRVRFPHMIVVAWLMVLCTVVLGHAEKPASLVVGNGAYRHADQLAKPVNDAREMRDTLAKLRLDVIYGKDLAQKALRPKIRQFAGHVEGADLAVMYFVGHGATFGDTPHVVPVDAEFAGLDAVPYELVAVETLIGELRRAFGVSIAILDACRDSVAQKATIGEICITSSSTRYRYMD
jgi:hypothetical protein